MKKQGSSGQAILMVVLTMMVALTIALVIFVNALSSVRMTSTEEASERAFAAAEAGIEDLLTQNSNAIQEGYYPISVGEMSAGVEVAELNMLDTYVKQGDAATLQLRKNQDTTSPVGEITIYWSKKNNSAESPSNCDDPSKTVPAALVVEIWTETATGMGIDYRVYYTAGDSSCRIWQSGYRDSLPGGTEYLSKIELPNRAQDVFYRLRPVYNNASIKVVGGALPPQQQNIISTSTMEGSGETRSVSVVKTLPELPGIFDYVLYSGSAIEKESFIPLPSSTPTSTPTSTPPSGASCPTITETSSGFESGGASCYVQIGWNAEPGVNYFAYRNSSSYSATTNPYTIRWIPCANNSLYRIVPEGIDFSECPGVAVMTP
jgi:Tfp pilus assembly protein PilX